MEQRINDKHISKESKQCGGGTGWLSASAPVQGPINRRPNRSHKQEQT